MDNLTPTMTALVLARTRLHGDYVGRLLAANALTLPRPRDHIRRQAGYG